MTDYTDPELGHIEAIDAAYGRFPQSNPIELKGGPCARCTELQAQVDALRAGLATAERFIANGIEFGRIHMPDADCPDPAHDTLPLIRALLSDPAPANPLAERVKQLEAELRDICVAARQVWGDPGGDHQVLGHLEYEASRKYGWLYSTHCEDCDWEGINEETGLPCASCGGTGERFYTADGGPGNPLPPDDPRIATTREATDAQ